MNKLLYDLAFSRFLSLVKLSFGDGQDYSCLCQNCVFEVTSQLKKRDLSSDETERIAFLIAVMTCEKYLLINFSTDCSTSQSLTDAKITQNPQISLDAVLKLKHDTLLSCADLLKTKLKVLKMM